jgi:PAS domain S-box-containing protein
MSFYSQVLRLLVIEDNPGDFILIKDYLSKAIESPVIVRAESFDQAKELISGHIAFDAILLGLSLSDTRGEVQVHETIQLAGPTPVIALGSNTDIDFGVKTISLGVSDYLRKDEVTASDLYKSILYSIERKRTFLKQKEQVENYRGMFYLSPLPMFVFESGTFRFLAVNEATIRHYGYSREEFLSMTVKEIRPQEEIPTLEELVKTTINPGLTYQGINKHSKKNGEMILVEIQSSAIEFDGRKARLVLINDVTERMKYLQAIEDWNKKLQEIAWIQSHVVRAPLARIMGLVEFINSKSEPVEGLSNPELLNNILDSANELDEVIRAIVTKTEQVENGEGQ